MMRIGHGYDVHRLTEGRELWLGGVHIPFEKGLDGHSDADVLIHAICDALLGAAALGDLGQHFPDTSPEHAGRDSRDFLRAVKALIQKNGYEICNVDSTVVAQAPKLAAVIPQMRQLIAQDLKITPDQVSIKATTTERLGFEGEGEGISAHAVVLISSTAAS